MLKAVIDTNCLLASISPKSVWYRLYELFEEEKFEWYVSNEILTEYEEKLTDIYSASTARLVLTILMVAPNVSFQEAYYKWQLIEQDADDNKFVDVAIAGGVDYVVTNDNHFNVLKPIDFPHVTIIGLTEFLELFDFRKNTAG
ncbi:putative toxin-antitoxin system toxin component, PIN family [Arsenicibacter rosenii]|uniref:Putative toxin-antitoxin system toxin component, PIN family n=1 Tax=Arsenicibacter rosenii TaxID=1750698 RepID=A0A1S2VCS0_9BACT|nr:putative toxin-antitoxin system toxin component, PIN family [Arsenicibacter rosenii]OIN56220.1 putative toxin-antitoxin system toxin component, PIN family [Arsenicibacter rosenii]